MEFQYIFKLNGESTIKLKPLWIGNTTRFDSNNPHYTA